MEREKLLALLKKVERRRVSVDAAFEALRQMPYEDLGFAKLDHHRLIRSGMPEVVFCQGKSPKQIQAIFRGLQAQSDTVLLTRADARIYRAVRRLNRKAVFNPLARTIVVSPGRPQRQGQVAVVCAGTADVPAAEEAAVTAEAFGARVERVYDVGVAGLHRLLGCFRRIAQSRCFVALAGMDGALPSVIGGLAAAPVIAVPTSTGYGAGFGGVSALLTMLNSCAPNVSVVNIDNGFGAGYIAALINRRQP